MSSGLLRVLGVKHGVIPRERSWQEILADECPEEEYQQFLRNLEKRMAVKDDSELRHIFAHFGYALDYLGKSCIEDDEERKKDYIQAAQYEIESVEGLYMWDEPENDEEGPFLNSMRRLRHGREKKEEL